MVVYSREKTRNIVHYLSVSLKYYQLRKLCNYMAYKPCISVYHNNNQAVNRLPVFLQSNDHLLIPETAQQNPKTYSEHTRFPANEMNHFCTPDTCLIPTGDEMWQEESIAKCNYFPTMVPDK